ncbi:hypothetical protein BN903_84 [Halorubrum sp. AJ67]|nr:hypothetical protein BN903_84 [Halorubrum sp. AJ67]
MACRTPTATPTRCLGPSRLHKFTRRASPRGQAAPPIGAVRRGRR